MAEGSIEIESSPAPGSAHSVEEKMDGKDPLAVALQRHRALGPGQHAAPIAPVAAPLERIYLSGEGFSGEAQHLGVKMHAPALSPVPQPNLETQDAQDAFPHWQQTRRLLLATSAAVTLAAMAGLWVTASRHGTNWKLGKRQAPRTVRLVARTAPVLPGLSQEVAGQVRPPLPEETTVATAPDQSRVDAMEPAATPSKSPGPTRHSAREQPAKGPKRSRSRRSARTKLSSYAKASRTRRHKRAGSARGNSRRSIPNHQGLNPVHESQAPSAQLPRPGLRIEVIE